jgi:hypothetical protein
VNPDINRDQTAFVCLEPGPSGRLSTRALVLSFHSADPIADGTLYTCDVQIPAGTAPGRYRVACAEAGASDPDGSPIISRCQEGEIVVVDNTSRSAVEGPGASGSAGGCQVGSTAAASGLPVVPAFLLAWGGLVVRRRRWP